MTLSLTLISSINWCLMDKDIASGWYMTEDGNTTSVAHWMEEDDFRSNGGVMNHETGESCQ